MRAFKKKRRGRKSQVTLIMGIAIVLIVIFAVFYFTSRTSVKRQLGLEVSKELTKDVQPINEYITQCLGQVAKEGIELQGLQGGWLYVGDGGTVSNNNKMEPKSIEYNVVQPTTPKLDGGVFVKTSLMYSPTCGQCNDPDGCVCASNCVTTGNVNNGGSCGGIGGSGAKTDITACTLACADTDGCVCASNCVTTGNVNNGGSCGGPRTGILNKRTDIGQEVLVDQPSFKHYRGSPKYPWVQFPYPDNLAPTPAPNAALADSDYELQKSFTGVAQNGFGDLSTTIPRLEGSAQAIKEQLQAYISNKFDERCSDFSSFEKQGFSITKNDKKVEVLIAENDVKVSMKMPVEIADVSTNSLAKIDAFETSVPVKLKQIQRIVSEFIQFDKKDISYEIKNRGDFLVTKSGPINGALGRYRVVSVIDSNSNIDGKAYRFQFAVKNRPPALNYLNKVCIQKNPGDSISLDDVMNKIIPDDTLCTTTPPAAALSGMNCLQGGGDRSKQKAWDPDEDDNDGLVFELKLLRPAPDNTEENWPVPPGDEMPDVGSLRGRIKVSDGESSDYQNIEIRNPSVATC